MEVPIKLYFAPNSRAVKIAWLLEELGLSYEIEKFKVGDRALRTPEYYKLHPMGRVPVLEDGEGRLQPQNNDASFPDYLQWLHYAEGSIMQQVNSLVVETILLPLEKKNDVNVARASKLLKIALINVDNRLEDRDYLAIDFSGADIMTGHACFAARRLNLDISEMVNLNQYIDRLLTRPALKRAMLL